MDGDRESEAVIFRQKPEERELRVNATVVPGEMSEEVLEAMRERLEHFQHSIANAAVVRTVTCGDNPDDQERIWLMTQLVGTETDVHAIAERSRQEVKGMAGVKDEVGAVDYHLSMPVSMARAHAVANGTINLS